MAHDACVRRTFLDISLISQYLTLTYNRLLASTNGTVLGYVSAEALHVRRVGPRSGSGPTIWGGRSRPNAIEANPGARAGHRPVGVRLRELHCKGVYRCVFAGTKRPHATGTWRSSVDASPGRPQGYCSLPHSLTGSFAHRVGRRNEPRIGASLAPNAQRPGRCD